MRLRPLRTRASLRRAFKSHSLPSRHAGVGARAERAWARGVTVSAEDSVQCPGVAHGVARGGATQHSPACTMIIVFLIIVIALAAFAGYYVGVRKRPAAD